VLDIDLAGLDGWEVLERIRQLTDVPVVMPSSHADELEKVRALQAGVDDYVTKPFGPQELLAALVNLAGRTLSAEQLLGLPGTTRPATRGASRSTSATCPASSPGR
jgi:DNA-binding response OmpR family regulator